MGEACGMTELNRLVIDFRAGEVVVRCLYRTQDGPSHAPATLPFAVVLHVCARPDFVTGGS
jgi:hypothetical protein